jgi:hypothetical protein
MNFKLSFLSPQIQFLSKRNWIISIIQKNDFSLLCAEIFNKGKILYLHKVGSQSTEEKGMRKKE